MAEKIPMTATARPLKRSLDALDHAEIIILAAGDIKAAGETLWNFPMNQQAYDDARDAMMRVRAALDDLERLTL